MEITDDCVNAAGRIGAQANSYWLRCHRMIKAMYALDSKRKTTVVYQ